MHPVSSSGHHAVDRADEGAVGCEPSTEIDHLYTAGKLSRSLSGGSVEYRYPVDLGRAIVASSARSTVWWPELLTGGT